MEGLKIYWHTKLLLDWRPIILAALATLLSQKVLIEHTCVVVHT